VVGGSIVVGDPPASIRTVEHAGTVDHGIGSPLSLLPPIAGQRKTRPATEAQPGSPFAPPTTTATKHTAGIIASEQAHHTPAHQRRDSVRTYPRGYPRQHQQPCKSRQLPVREFAVRFTIATREELVMRWSSRQSRREGEAGSTCDPMVQRGAPLDPRGCRGLLLAPRSAPSGHDLLCRIVSGDAQDDRVVSSKRR
jgi:hypothetical protein